MTKTPAGGGHPDAGRWDPLLEAGYGAIEALQGFRSGWLDALAHGISFLGDEPFYLLLLPVLYWAVNRGMALRLTVLFLFTAWAAETLKALLDLPRPDPDRVAVLEPRGTGGLPSGHAMGSLVVWGYLGARWPAPAGKLRSALLMGIGPLLLLIGASRLYLGAHFPHDVVAGWLAGALLLLAFLRCARALEARVRVAGGHAAGPGIAIALLAALLLLLQRGEALPPAAALLGAGIGLAWERGWIRFSSGGAAWPRVGRALVGLAGALLIWAGLAGPLAPLGDPGRILRYALLGFWVTGAAPWLFVRVRLAVGAGRPIPPARASPD